MSADWGKETLQTIITPPNEKQNIGAEALEATCLGREVTHMKQFSARGLMRFVSDTVKLGFNCTRQLKDRNLLIKPFSIIKIGDLPGL